jgi:hypothetical protein
VEGEGGDDGAGSAVGAALEGATVGPVPDGAADGAGAGAAGEAPSTLAGMAFARTAQSPSRMPMRRTKDGAIPSTYTGRRQQICNVPEAVNAEKVGYEVPLLRIPATDRFLR